MANPITITAITGGGAGSGTFTATAAGVTTISDADVAATSIITFSPANTAAGTLLRLGTCWVGNIGAGSFTFNVSATAVAGITGTEIFNYIIQRES